MRLAVPVVEAAYRWAPTETEWLSGVVHEVDRYRVGSGVVGYAVSLTGRPRVTSLVRSPGAPEESGEALRALTHSVSNRVGRAIYGPTEFAGNAAYRVSRVAPRALATSAGRNLPPMWAVVGGDPRTRVVVLGFLAKQRLSPTDPYPSRERARQLGMIGAHLGSALRLRNALAPAQVDDAATEAVLTPQGRVLHASGSAVAARESLAEAALAIERARLRKVPDDEALRLWNALVSGRWSVVDIVERDGKRLLLARRNEVKARPDVVALTDLERDVAWLASMGHSYKFVAYELGITVSMVVRRLTSAMKKLGIGSRRELLRAFAAERAR